MSAPGTVGHAASALLAERTRSDGLGTVGLCRRCGHTIAWVSHQLPDRERSRAVARMVRSQLELREEPVEATRARRWDHAAGCDARPARRPRPAVQFSLLGGAS